MIKINLKKQNKNVGLIDYKNCITTRDGGKYLKNYVAFHFEESSHSQWTKISQQIIQ
jgi:ribosomal protein L35AE/L33A